MPGPGRRGPSPLWGAIGGLFAGVTLVLMTDPCRESSLGYLVCESLYEFVGVASNAGEVAVLVGGFVAFGTTLGWIGRQIGERGE